MNIPYLCLLLQIKMYRQYVRFQSAEGSVTELISMDVLAEKLSGLGLCALHSAAVQTHLVGEDYVAHKNISKWTKRENDELVALEKNLDISVLKARIDVITDTSSVPRNENTSVADTQDKSRPWQMVNGREKGQLCGGYGDINSTTYGVLVEHEYDRLSGLGGFIPFPMVDMDDEFGPHWKRNDDLCKSNGFNNGDAAHFNLNHVRFSYVNYKHILDTQRGRKDYNGAFEVVTDNNPMADYGNLRGKFKKQYLRENGVLEKHDILYDEPGEDLPTTPALDYKTMFEEVSVTSRFGDINVVEDLKFDRRLLADNYLDTPNYFAQLDVPPIIMGTVLRDGTADYHSVYYEDKNAMGQVGKWATILIVRPTRREKRIDPDTGEILRIGQDKRFESEAEEYVERYASKHTFVVVLPNRQGYSAGDSKFYCWRVAQWLHDHWSSHLSGESLEMYNRTKRRCIIQDDQVLPWLHAVVKFNDRDRLRKSKDESVQEFDVRKEAMDVIRVQRLANTDTEVGIMESAASSTEKIETLYDEVGERIHINNADKKNPKYARDNDQYKFRAIVRDVNGESMMAPGNSRFPLTHAAAFMYMNRVSDIMQAGIVCANQGDPIKWNIPLKNKQESMCCWLINLHLFEPGLFATEGKPFLQSALNPAFQAAEDLMMFRVARDRGVKVVSCSTVRWRKAPSSKHSTAGRSDVSKEIPPPFRPIIKYHDMLRTVRRFEPNFPTVVHRAKWPAFPPELSIESNCWPFTKIGWTAALKGRKWYARQFWIKYEDNVYSCTPDMMKLSWGTDGKADDKKESEILFLSGGYGARHRFNVVVLKMLDAVLRGNVQEGGGVDDITKQLAAMSVGETKTSAPAKKKKNTRKKKQSNPEPILTFEEEDYNQQAMKKQHVYQDMDGDLIYYFTDGRVQINNRRNVLRNWDNTMVDFMSNNPGIKVKLLGKFILTEDNDVFESISARLGVKNVGYLLSLNPFYDEDTVFGADALVIIPE